MHVFFVVMDLLFLLVLLMYLAAYPFRRLTDVGVAFVSLLALCYTSDGALWVILYELQTVLFFILCLVWSSSAYPTIYAGARFHMALTQTFFTLSLSAMCIMFYFTTGRSVFLLVSFCLKLAVFPSCYWLVEIHAQIPTSGSLLLSAIYVKLGWLGLLKFSVRSTTVCCWGMMGEVIVLSAGAGVLFLSLCLVCASTVKVLLALQSCIHTNLVIPYAVMTPHTSELFGCSWAHSISSGALFLLLSSASEQYSCKELTWISCKGTPFSTLVLAILVVTCAPFTLGARSEMGLLRMLVSVYPSFTFLHVVLFCVPKLVLTWLFFHYIMCGMSGSGVESMVPLVASPACVVVQGALSTNVLLYWSAL